MNGRTTRAIVVDDGGARELIRATDALSRQTATIARVAIATTPAHSAAIAESLAVRLGAVIFARASSADAINAAAQDAVEDVLAIVPSGYRLDRDCLEACLDALEADPAAVAAAAAVCLESDDATRGMFLDRPDLTVSGVLADPSLAPAVWCIRRRHWGLSAGLDQNAGALASLDLAVRLLLAGPILQARKAVARRTISGSLEWPPDGTSDSDCLSALRYVLEKHRSILDRVMTDVLVQSEAGFGVLRDRHRALVAQRDKDLAELDRTRAETAHLRAWLDHHGRAALDWGDLRRTNPISRDWGYDRGTPVDRLYIHAFLAAHSSDIRATVLEVQENDFTRRFGGSRVVRSEVVDVDDRNPLATLIADLRSAPHLDAATFDCIILTQTIHVIDDATAVVKELHRLLKPSGVLLATVPCASRVCLEYGAGGDLWRATPDGAMTLFESVFGPGAVESKPFGNVFTNLAFLQGLAGEELNQDEVDSVDPYFPLLVGIRATKTPARPRRRSSRRGAVLLYHRIDDQDDVHRLNIGPANFEQHLAWLRRNCCVMPLDTLLATAPGDLPDRAVAITFDDGYADNLEIAAPALERWGLPATFFLTTRWLEEPGEYWWDTLDRVVIRGELPPAVSIETPDGALVLPTATEAERFDACRRLHTMLVAARLEHRDRIVGSLQRFGSGASARRPLLADEVRELTRIPGMSIGAHTVNHLSLAHQTDEVIRRELDDSRAALERVVGQPVADVAYPYGSVAAPLLDHARSTWRWGCACDDRPVGLSFDAARVPRIEVRDEGADWLAVRLRFA